MQQQNVLCAILHTDNTSIAWSFGLRNLAIPGTVVGLAGMPFDHARNQACQIALANGFQHIFFLDSDVIPPANAVLRLLSHNLPFVSGLYCRRSPPHSVPVMIRSGQWVTQFPDNALVEVDLVGAGCMLIKRSVLEQMPPQRPGHHWFDWRVNYQGINGEDGKPLYPPGECLSEDFTFCQHLRKTMGIKTYVDTGCKCRHVGLAESTFGSFVPLNTCPQT